MILGQTEKFTYRLHLSYSIIEGFILGILALNEFVFIKSLKGSDIQLSFLVQFSMVVFLFLIFINEFLNRIRNKKKLLRITAIATRLPMLLLLFFPHSAEAMDGKSFYHLIFLGIFLIYYLASPIINPIINLFLKNCYRHQNFGPLYSKASRLNKVVMMITTFLYGLLLDFDKYSFTYILPISAIAGIISIFMLSRIPYSSKEIIQEKLPFLKSIKHSFKGITGTLTKNKPFRDFENGFMFYGFAYLASVSVMTLFFDRALNLNYSSIAFYKNAYNIIAILSLPYFGKLIGRIDPRYFAAITFGSICLFLTTLAISPWFPAKFEIFGITIYYILIVYIIFHSIFAATMALLWNIGSAYFCNKEEAADYQATHLSLTGFRSIFSPIIGILLYQWFGFTPTFLIVAFSLFLGILLMIWSKKKHPLIPTNI